MWKTLLPTIVLVGIIPRVVSQMQTNINEYEPVQTSPVSFISPPYSSQAVERVLTYPPSIATNLPDYQENFVLTSNGDYVANTDPARFWRHGVWKEMTNGWRVILASDTNYPWYVGVGAGSLVTNSGWGYVAPPYGKFAKFELLGPGGKIMEPRPNAGTNMIKWCDRGFADNTNVPPWASPTNGSLAVDFPEAALATDFPHYPIGYLADNFIFLARNSPTAISHCELDDLYSITNEGDYTLTVQPVLYNDETAKDGHPPIIQTNSFLHRVDLPSVSIKVHLAPNIK